MCLLFVVVVLKYGLAVWPKVGLEPVAVPFVDPHSFRFIDVNCDAWARNLSCDLFVCLPQKFCLKVNQVFQTCLY